MVGLTTSLLLLLVYSTLLVLSTAQNPPIVVTTVGSIQGYYDASQNVSRFTNIPFAFPPLSILRFKAPSPPPYLSPSPYPANATSIIDCIQPSRSGGSGTQGQEDCLYLSVTAPNPLPAPNVGLPVIVYICGGAFQQCYGNDAASWLRQTGQFIFVNINYRLGIFGFFALQELSAQQSPISHSGNQGLLDQQAAMRWVQQNIAAFGGDPNRVTLQGESAGSISICYHLISPLSSGLFRAAIMESGGCEVFLPWGSYTMAEQEAYVRANVLERTDCARLLGPDARIECLTSMVAGDLYDLYQSSTQLGWAPPGQRASGDVGYWPVLDGVVLPDTPTAMFRAKKVNRVSVLIGTNAGETVMWVLGNGPPVNGSYPYNYSQATVDDTVRVQSGGNDTIVAFYQQAAYARRYNGSRAVDVSHIYVDATTAEAFHCPARRVAKAMSAAGCGVFHYRWNYLQAGDPTAWTGLAAHSRELAVLFYYGGPSRPEDATMAAQIQNYLHRFIAYTDVNHQSQDIDAAYAAVYANHSLPVWPSFDYQAGSDRSLLIHNDSDTLAHFAIGAAVHADQCDELWDAAVPLPNVERRITQCQHDECSSSSDPIGNVCIDNYNSTYYCDCDESAGYAPSSDDQACLLMSSSSSSSSGLPTPPSSSSSASFLSSTSSPSSTSSSSSVSSGSTGGHNVSSSSVLTAPYSSSSPWSASSSSSSTGSSDEGGLTCGLWCYVAIALIVLLSLGFVWMVYRMYTNSRKRHEAAAASSSRSPRTDTGSSVPSISSSGGGSTADGGDEYSESTSQAGPARVARKKKKVKRIRVDTGAGTSDALLADDRV